MSNLSEWKKWWRVVPEESHDGWLELNDPEGKFNAGVRYDGCINLRKWHNTGGRPDYIHLCFDDIERFRILVEMAEEYWSDSDRWNAWTNDDYAAFPSPSSGTPPDVSTTGP